jgi:hypothetical protein
MARELYKDRWKEAPEDSLRLADEFRIYLGEAALTDFLHRQITDASWEPGNLHRTLMELPWSDVLTTNYDTLLERASHRHRPVRDEADLSQIRGSRVIKLHGSIDSNTHLIISEDDFRTYPIKHAAFVNTARQIFLENELCLLGFSGDDPNFLQWSGWVRDHLAEKARRIYLVGSLNLSAAKRRLLENRGVSPIDFAPLVANLEREDQEKKCCELFLSYLTSRKPQSAMEWQPLGHDAYGQSPSNPITFQKELQDPAFAQKIFHDLLTPWRWDYENCPSWLVIPKKTRELIGHGTNRTPWSYLKALPLLDNNTRAEFLFLLLWRKSINFEIIDLSLEDEMMNILVQPFELESKKRLFILIRLLSEARYRRDEARFIEISSLLEKSTSVGTDARAELIAERLRWARDGLDYATLEKEVETLSGPSPVWPLVKASLISEIGETKTAQTLAQQSRENLADRARRDRGSASAASRFAWASALTKAFNMSKTWSLNHGEKDEDLANGYDAKNEVDLVSLKIRSDRLRRKEEPDGFQPTFGAGHYKDHSQTVRLRSGFLGDEAETVFRFADAAGLPLRLDNMDILGWPACYALDSEPLYTLPWYLRLVRSITAESSPFLAKYFSEISIAKLDAAVASELFERLLSAANYWQIKTNPANPHSSMSIIERLKILVEILSRLVVRCDVDSVDKAFRFALRISNSPKAVHPWLYEPIEHLLARCLNALPREEQSNLALDCLEFPLPLDLQPMPFRWPDPAADLFSRRISPHRPQGDSRWRAAVAAILAAAGSTGQGRTMAVHRLAYLSSFDCLEADEIQSFKTLLWSKRNIESGDLPSGVDLFPHVIATLPAMGDIDPFRVAYSALFEGSFDPAMVEQRLSSIVAASKEGSHTLTIRPQHDRALWLLDELPSLMPKVDNTGDPFGTQLATRRIGLIGETIGYAILPQLLPSDLNEERLAFVLQLGQLGAGGGALAGWHELARAVPPLLARVVADVRRAIRRGNLFDTAGAAYALGTWATKHEDERFPPIPDVLKDSLLASLEARSYESLHARLWATRQLVKNRGLSEMQLEGLTESIRDLSSDLSYDAMPHEGSGAVGITAARAEFVRLVNDIITAGRPTPTEAIWVLRPDHDPLPEVRFAADRME